jgi:hypothetical protein
VRTPSTPPSSVRWVAPASSDIASTKEPLPAPSRGDG